MDLLNIAKQINLISETLDDVVNDYEEVGDEEIMRLLRKSSDKLSEMCGKISDRVFRLQCTSIDICEIVGGSVESNYNDM